MVSTPWRCGPISTPGAMRLNSSRIVMASRAAGLDPGAPCDRVGPSAQVTGRSRPAARAASFFCAQAASTLSLWGRIGQCSSRLLNSSQ